MRVPQVRAPRDNHAKLALPSLDTVPRLLADNKRRLRQAVDILGMPLAEIRQQARDSILDLARSYLREAGEPIPEVGDGDLLLAGHQPELFHPGVWLKNFALARLSRQHGIGLNLVVDNDTAKSTQIQVPSGARLAGVPFDAWQVEIPFEERRVLDEALFAGLPGRLDEWTESWPYRPIVHAFWRDMLRQDTPYLGERIVRTRRMWERRWGCHNLELPLSRLCDTDAFARFACHLLAELPSFHSTHNDAVHAYRRSHGMRSKNHPVPDLARDGDWLEAPLWAWSSSDPQRRRVFARNTADKIEIRAGNEVLTLGSVTTKPEQCWRQLSANGLKIRTRALTTTLFARVFLGDLFLHGIGGGKYDELTDAILQEFYGIKPPAFLILSGTLLLPLPRHQTTSEDIRRLQRLRRDLFWNPQRHIADGTQLANFSAGQAHDLAERKRWLQAPIATHRQRKQRARQLRLLTENLRAFTHDRYEAMATKIDDTARLVQENQVRSRRDFSFVLYPEEELRTFLMNE